MKTIIIAAVVAAVVSIVFNIVLAHHLTYVIDRYEKETDKFAKDKLEEIKKIVVDAHCRKESPTAATVGSEETKIKGITEDVRRELKNANIAEKESGLYEKAQKFAEGLMDRPVISPNEVAVLPQLLEVLLQYSGAGEQN